MRLLDRYILTRFLSILFTTLLAFVLLFLIVDIVEHLDTFIDTKMPRSAVLAYYFYTLPWFVSIGLPMATLLATFFSMGLLHKNNEITAMKASGFSIRRVGLSILLAGGLISIGSFFFDDTVVSSANRGKANLQSQYMTREYRRKHKVIKQNIFLQRSSNEFMAIDRFDYRTQEAHGVYLQRFTDNYLTERIDIDVLKWDEDAQQWRGLNYWVRSFVTDLDTMLTVHHGEDTLLTLAIQPLDLIKMSVTPEEMRYGELKSFITGLIRNGVDPTRWQVTLHFKVAFAFTSFIMVLFGLPLSVGVGRPKASLAVGAGISIFVIFGYYVTIKLGQSLGFKGILEPLPSVWLPNAIFLGLGFFLLLKLRS